MSEPGRHTLSEILSQPTVWADALALMNAQSKELTAFWQGQAFERVIFTGCGSTYYLSLHAASLMQRLTGVPATAYPASELVLFPDTVFAPTSNTLLIAVSRSGETTETIEAIQLFRKHLPGKVIVVTCYSESELAELADIVLAVDSAREESLAQTRSFSSMAIVTTMLAAFFSGEEADFSRLPAIAARLLEAHADLVQRLGTADDLTRFFFLGSDTLYGLACEAMLKMKEMSLSYSEAYHTLEFRHGPMSMIDEQSLVIGLLSDDAYRPEVAVLQDMRQRGARLLAIAEDDREGVSQLGYFVPLQSGLPLWARAIAYLPVLQLLAYRRAIHNNQDPDHAGNLNAVVVLDSLVT